MGITVLLLFSILIASNQTLHAEDKSPVGNEPANEITPEEQESFNLVYHDGTERFPFELLETLDGEQFVGGSLNGKYVLINLWSTWCPFCRREKPSMQKLFNDYSGETFTVLAVSLGEEVETVRGYMDKERLTIPVALDRKEQLKERFAPRRPWSYIVDKEGYILAEIQKSQEWDSETAKKVLRYFIRGLDIAELKEGENE